MTLAEKQAKRIELLNKIKEMRAADGTDNAVLSNLLTEAENLSAEIETDERAEALLNHMAAPAPRAVKPTPIVPASRDTVGNGGFKNVGEFLNVLITSRASGLVDPRLRNAATVFGSEGVPADGGYALPPDFRAGINSMLKTPYSLLTYLDPIYTPSNQVTLSTDEETPWSATGISPAQIAEGVSYTETKPVVKPLSIPLVKYGALINVTEEAIEDGTQLDSFVQDKAADKLTWKLNAAIYSAFSTSTAKVAVAKGSLGIGAAADLDKFQKMLVAMSQAWRQDALWLMNPQYEASLMNMVIGQFPVYVAGGTVANQPLSTLFGRPILFTELCAAVGTEGDVMLVNPRQFFGAQKAQGVKAAITPYLYWNQDLQSFKISVRVGVKCKWSAPLTRPDATTAGPVVTVATR